MTDGRKCHKMKKSWPVYAMWLGNVILGLA